MSAIGRGLLRRANLELTEGEEVLWLGRPVAQRVVRYSLRVALISVVALAVAGLGYAFDWWTVLLGDLKLYRVLAARAPEILGSIAVFVALAAGGAVVWSRWITPQMWYVVTTRRLVFLQGRSAASHWMGPYDLTTVQLVDHGDGTGDLLFRRTRTGYDPAAGRMGAPPPDLWAELGQHVSGAADEQEVDAVFLGIRNAPAVRQLILEAYGRGRP